jgi:predicted alpha/beta-hydrolase family hydrolase
MPIAAPQHRGRCRHGYVEIRHPAKARSTSGMVIAMAEIFKFPYDASRRVQSRKPRRSKNGTPEERAAKAAAVQGAPCGGYRARAE